LLLLIRLVRCLSLSVYVTEAVVMKGLSSWHGIICFRVVTSSLSEIFCS